MNRPGARIAVDTDAFRGAVLVRDEGPRDAPVVLLVHGFCGSNGWWDDTARDLEDACRVVRVDLPGHGGTGGHAADAPVQAGVVQAVLDELALDDVTAVGHSFGADIVAELAEHSPRIGRVIIVCQAPDYSDADFPPGSALMTLPVLAPLLHRGGRLGTHALGVALRLRRSTDERTRRLAALAFADFAALDTAMFRIVLRERGARLARRPLDAQLRDSGRPALVLLGGNDDFYGDRSAGRYRAACARVEVVADAGHSLQLEQPEFVARAVREFVRDGADERAAESPRGAAGTTDA